MLRTVRVFVLPSGKPGSPPALGRDLEVDARGDDQVSDAVCEALARRGERLRALSHTPSGLLAYVEAST